ncbi:MAG TPA: nucleotide exchange factor GrpE [Mucilaginibacter sp.]|jgi:molecular chaperone GrpE|nr:nucleotide exchange factor GrpE [Mucilaginibacter sp.]
MLKKKKKEDIENPEGLNGSATENSQAVIPEVEEIEELPTAAELLKEELATANDKYLRLYAEFDNFRRRTIKEREEARKMEGKDLIVSLLPVLDDFERALRSMENAADVIPIKEGVALVQHKLKNILSQKGLKVMESIGNPFDAELQEAITNIPAPTEEWKGKVIDEMEKGYYLNDKVVRFAKVIVGA